MVLQQEFTTLLEYLRCRGFHLPLHVVLIGSNGSLFAAEVSSTERGINLGEIVRQGSERPQLPIRLVVMDTAGSSARTVSEPPRGLGPTPVIH